MQRVSIPELLYNFVVLKTHHCVKLLVHGVRCDCFPLAFLGHLVPIQSIPILLVLILVLHVLCDENLLRNSLLNVLLPHTDDVLLE